MNEQVCPYCGSTEVFSAPVPLCDGMPPELGITVPVIQQCRACGATLSPAAFVPGSEAFARALALAAPTRCALT
ncbi:MAG: hypothetical protein JXD18_14945 [Anaerolineae bacterium]|nr:hypothetical protein [Anaerolineae bacterium]